MMNHLIYLSANMILLMDFFSKIFQKKVEKTSSEGNTLQILLLKSYG